MTQTAETIQEAMHREGLKTYDELRDELAAAQRDITRLELHLDTENVLKKAAYRLADKYEWRAKLWRTVGLSIIGAVIAWRLWLIMAGNIWHF